MEVINALKHLSLNASDDIILTIAGPDGKTVVRVLTLLKKSLNLNNWLRYLEPCLSIISNMLASSNAHVSQIILRNTYISLLDICDKLITFSIKNLELDHITDVLWSLSNIAADSEEYIEMLLRHPIMHQVVKLGLKTGVNQTSIDIRGEVIYIISNIVLCGSVHQAQKLTQNFPQTTEILKNGLQLESNLKRFTLPERFVLTSFQTIEKLLELDD